MDMTPALPALLPSRWASTRSDVVSEKEASRTQRKFFCRTKSYAYATKRELAGELQRFAEAGGWGS
jgi:hypothetical protein